MIFKDRADAGEKLTPLLKEQLINNKNSFVVVSLIRGGVIVGDVIARKFFLPHLPLVATKISAPHQPELAIGAYCFNSVYLESSIINSLQLSLMEINKQKQLAKTKFDLYCQRFKIKKGKFLKLKNQSVILVDDGIATGSTARAANIFLKKQGTKTVVLVSPVAPTDFDEQGFDKVIILHKDPYLSAISQFYESFPQVEDNEVKKILSFKNKN